MSKVTQINKNLLFISKFPLNKKICTLHTSSVPHVKESYIKFCTYTNKLVPSISPRNSAFQKAKRMCLAENVLLNSGLLQISCMQNVMYSTQKNTTVLEEQSGGENDTVKEEDLKQSNIEKELKEKIELLGKEVEEFKDKYQRSLADRENLRLRLEKQISDSKLYGIQSFCKDLLEVSDIFRKALECVPEEKMKDADPLFIGLYDGVTMTENQLLSVFRRHGLQRIIPAEGDKFDPSVQEAMFEVSASDGKEPGTVAHVVRTGWKLHNRCVRSAQVGVIKQ